MWAITPFLATAEGEDADDHHLAVLDRQLLALAGRQRAQRLPRGANSGSSAREPFRPGVAVRARLGRDVELEDRVLVALVAGRRFAMRSPSRLRSRSEIGYGCAALCRAHRDSPRASGASRMERSTGRGSAANGQQRTATRGATAIDSCGSLDGRRRAAYCALHRRADRAAGVAVTDRGSRKDRT